MFTDANKELPPVLVSKHGIVLSYIWNNFIVQDGEASYVDDILDGFDTWNGQGSLKAHIRSLLLEELRLFDAQTQPTEAALQDVLKATRATLLQKIKLFEGEPEGGLIATRESYLKSPEETTRRMLSAAKGSDRHLLSVRL